MTNDKSMGRPLSAPAYRERINRLQEPERSVAWEEFWAILENYGVDRNLLSVKPPEGTTGDSITDAKLAGIGLETVSALPLELGGMQNIDRIAEVAVWAAVGIVGRMTTGNEDTQPNR